jgi:hypothetical protein
MADTTLNYPPFPILRWDDFSWVGEINLPTWTKFTAGRASRTEKRATHLSVSSIDSDNLAHPLAEQVAAFDHLLTNETQVVGAVIDALIEYCPGDAYDGDDERFLNVQTRAQLRPLVRLSSVHVLDVFKDKIACVGFQFRCDWDEEHGAGVMTHKGRVIATGQADCSFTQWIARQCLKKRNRRA